MVGTETKLVLHISIVKGFVHNPLHTWMAIVFKCPAAAATSKDVFFGGVIRDVETSHGFCIKSAPIIRSNWEYFHDKKMFENVVSWTFYSAAHKHVCRLLAQFLYCPFLLRNVALFWLSQPSETTFHFRFWEGQKPSDTACEWTCATGLACLSTNRSSFVNRGWAHTCRVPKLVGARWELPPKKSLNIMKVVANCVERYNNEREGCLKRGCLLNEIKQSTNAAGEAAIVQLLFFFCDFRPCPRPQRWPERGRTPSISVTARCYQVQCGWSSWVEANSHACLPWFLWMDETWCHNSMQIVYI